jgi:hypothetical protein
MQFGLCLNSDAVCSLARTRNIQELRSSVPLCEECGGPLVEVASSINPAHTARRENPVEPLKANSVNPASKSRQVSDGPELPVGRGVIFGMSRTALALTGAVIALGLSAGGFFIYSQVNRPPLGSGLDTSQLVPDTLFRAVRETRLRDQPTPQGTVVGKIAQDERILAMNTAIAAKGGSWRWGTSAGGLRGWIFDGDLIADAPVPVITPPPALSEEVVHKEPQTQRRTQLVEEVTPSTFYVCSKMANVRTRADPGSRGIGSFEFGTDVTVFAREIFRSPDTGVLKTWYKVRRGSITGWINSGLLESRPCARPIDDSEPEMETVTSDSAEEAVDAAASGATNSSQLEVIATMANLRLSPSLEASPLEVQMPQGTKLQSIESKYVDGRTWYLVAAPNGAQGWISERVVRTIY